MSTATFSMDADTGVDDALQYRAVHTGAILGFVLSVVMAIFTAVAAVNSGMSSVFVSLGNLAPLSICLWAFGRIKRDPELYTGRPLAMVGSVVAIVSLLLGVSYGAYIDLTEVPDGYTRIGFSEEFSLSKVVSLKPNELEERGGIKIPKEVAALDGKKVFIKGYIRPDSITVSKGIDRFLLVRDNQQCCFGDISSIKYYDQIDVNMVGSKRVDYDQGIFRMGGVLHVYPENATKGPTKPVFTLQADYAN
jgi:hypothetical protein